eukprot:472872-Prymnesium_polylepis.1
MRLSSWLASTRLSTAVAFERRWCGPAGPARPAPAPRFAVRSPKLPRSVCLSALRRPVSYLRRLCGS